MLAGKGKWVVAVSVIAALMAGCTSGRGKPADNTSEPVETPVAKKEPVEISFYSTGGDFNETGFNELFGEKIKQKFPHVTPKFIPLSDATKISNLVATGQIPDVMYLSIGSSTALVEFQLEYDISDLIKQYKYDLGPLEPAVVDNLRALGKGKIYGLPVYNNSMSLYYNKDLFDKFGVAYPKDGMTWDDLTELTKVMSRSDGGLQYRGLTMWFTAARTLGQYSANYLDPVTHKSNFASDNFRKQLEQLTQFAAIPGNQLTADNASASRQAAMFTTDRLSSMFMHFSVYGISTLKDTLNWDVATYPVMKEQPDIGPQAYPTYFYLTKNSKVKEQAFEVMAYLTSAEFQKSIARQGLLPILKDRDVAMKEFGQDIAYLRSKNLQALVPKKFAPPSIVTPEQLLTTTAGNRPLQTAYTDVVTGKSDINTALRAADEQYAAEVSKILGGK
ncbi:ABC transporter substrate-binding protein [Paenibacillus hemerocallicola]|nr:extracellular solute-binding protein [Paenibacillus hemerocallicola]